MTRPIEIPSVDRYQVIKSRLGNLRPPFAQRLTAEKLDSCIWLKPESVPRIGFAEWSGAEKLQDERA